MYGPTRERNNSRECEVWRHELANLRIQRLQLEQQDPGHPALQAVEAAIRVREQQLERAAAGAAYPGGTGGGTWQVRVVAKPDERMVDWSDMHGSTPCGEGFLAWRKLYDDVRYITWPEDKDWAWALARSEPKTLAEWKELFARVDLDVEDLDQDTNVVQEAGALIASGARVAEVGSLGERVQHQYERARCTLAAQRRVLGPTRACGHVRGSVLRECCHGPRPPRGCENVCAAGSIWRKCCSEWALLERGGV
jgi:hypothetical protein